MTAEEHAIIIRLACKALLRWSAPMMQAEVPWLTRRHILTVMRQPRWEHPADAAARAFLQEAVACLQRPSLQGTPPGVPETSSRTAEEHPHV